MRKRFLSFLLAASAAFCFICSSAPEAHAIVPVGFVQSALASYVSSTGYKLYNDNGTGQDILGSLGELYDDYVTVSNKTITGQLASLAFLANSPYIYQDTSGQIVISKVAADIFQDFSDWIQTEYDVTVGSDIPTDILSSSGGSVSLLSGPSFTGLSYPISITNSTVFHWKSQSGSSEHYNSFLTSSECSAALFSTSKTTTFFIASKVPTQTAFDYGLSDYPSPAFNGSLTVTTFNGQQVCYGYVYGTGSLLESQFSDNSVTSFPSGSSTQTELAYHMLYGDLAVVPGVTGLAVTLAQAVADVIGQAKEDDAVVIGVGASAGATAQDIADMVAQGVKAQTLDPSVSITAEAVIDTPVQPYPDIDGLGLPNLGAALVERFPFCIPWDFVDTLRLFSADPQPINIKVDLIPQRVKTAVGISSDTSFDIDLSGEQYAKIGVFCRWGSLIAFCFGLFLLTKRLVWTA